MPKGYWIAQIEIIEPVAYGEYVQAAKGTIKRFGGRHLVRGGAYASPEGDWLSRHVIIEFEDYQTAVDCYASSDYQSAKAKRANAAKFELLIIEGCDGELRPD